MLLGSNIQRIKRSWCFGVHNDYLEGRRETLSEPLGSLVPPAMMTRFY
jgi:hypothetical protein